MKAGTARREVAQFGQRAAFGTLRPGVRIPPSRLIKLLVNVNIGSVSFCTYFTPCKIRAKLLIILALLLLDHQVHALNQIGVGC